MNKLKIEYVDINSIKPYENNAKLHPEEQIEQIKKSIEQFGMDDPIGIWKDEIVEGHGRLIACKELGYTEVPIIRLDHLTDEERKAYTLAHNKLTMNSDFDIDILNDELMNAFDSIDMSDFGFDLNFDDEDEEQEIVEDEEDLFDDIEKLDKHYGVPYQGNKSRIADIIINILPSGKRLVDLFGGGGAITHCALLSDKWKNYLYNDINPLITTLFMDAVNGKYHDENRVITREDFEELKERLNGVADEVIVNPLGEWTGGTDVDTGATNRKLGSDMGQSVTGGGLHGKDLSKADVSVNIYAFLKAQETGKPVELCCAIGDTKIDGKPYEEIVEIARQYIKEQGGFEKFAEWGLY